MSDYLIRELFAKPAVPTPPVANDMPYKTLVGVEIEMENAEDFAVPAGWSPHTDGSLRNGIELVFSRPQNGLDMYKTISAFYDAKIRFSAGPRTSTHIHVDMTDATLSQARAMFAFIYTVENALFSVIEENRKWTGYCMPLAEMNPQKIRSFMTATSVRDIHSQFGGRNQEKYYGFNIMSLKKHGTVELRYFTGGPTKEELLSWIVFCNELKAMSRSVSLKQLLDIDNISDLERLLLSHFPTWGPKLLRASSLQAMLDSLNEIAGLLEEDTGPSRSDMLVFITPTLTTYFYKTLLTTPQKKKAYQETLANMSVLSYSEFHNNLYKILISSDEKMARVVPELSSEYDSDDVAEPPSPLPGHIWIDDMPPVISRSMPDFALPGRAVEFNTPTSGTRESTTEHDPALRRMEDLYRRITSTQATAPTSPRPRRTRPGPAGVGSGGIV